MKTEESNYVIENTVAEDLPFVYWMFEEAIKYQKINNYKGWNDYDKTFLQNEVKQKLHFKVVSNNQILCIFSVCFSDPLIWREKEKGTSIYLHRVTVNPYFKGQSQFAKVLQWAIDFARNNQLESIRIDTWADNPTIIEYYKNYGFKFVENYKTADTKALPIQHRNLNVTLLEYRID